MSYVVLNQIGESPIGEIFQGCDFQTQRKVAILQIDSHLRKENYDANWKSLEKTFLMQQRYLDRVVDVDKESGRIFLEERGQSMSDLLQGPELRIPQRIVRSIIYDILILLSQFQEQGFVHGDIRPENLLLPVTPDNLRPIRLAYSPGIYYGKELIFSRRNRKYIAPEMLNPRYGTISSATDLYCLAFACLELIFGNEFNFLFSRIGADGNVNWSVLHGNSGEQLPPLKTVFPGIDYDLLYFFYTVTYRKVADRPRSIRQFFFEMQNRYVLHQILLHLQNEGASKQQIKAFHGFCNATPLQQLLKERAGTRTLADKKRIPIILSEATKYLRKIAIPDYVIDSLAYSVKSFVRPDRYDVTLEFQADLETIETGYGSDGPDKYLKSEYEIAPNFQTKTDEIEKTASQRGELVSNLTGREVVEVQKQEPTLWETFLTLLFGKKKKNIIDFSITEQNKRK